MATVNQILKYTVTADTNQAESSFKGLSGSAEKAGGKLGGLKDIAAGVGIGFGVENVLSFGQELFNVGQQAELFRSKAKTVFESSAGQVERWAEANAGAMGLTTSELEGATAAVGDLLKPMGYTAEAAAGMSMQITGLSGALSAWSGGTRSAAEVSQILQKSLLGERDGLKELGISITEADVQSRLAANGQKQLTGAALEQAKAQATLQMILEKSTDAQKAWSDGTMDGVKDSNEAKASFKELKEQLAAGLMPVFKELTRTLPEVTKSLEGMTPALKLIGEITDSSAFKLGDKIMQWVEPVHVIMKAIGEATKTFKELVDATNTYEKSTAIATEGVRAFNEALGKLPEQHAAAEKAAASALAVTRQDIRARVEHSEVTQVMAEKEKAAEKATKDSERAAGDYAKQLQELTRRNEEVLKATEDLTHAHEIDLPAALDDVTGTLLDYYDTLKESEEAQRGLSASSTEYQQEAIKQREAGRDLSQSMMDYAHEVLAAAEAQAALSDKQLTAEEKATILAGAMTDLGNRFPPLATKAAELAAGFGGIAGSAEDSAARTEVAADRIATAMEKMRDRVVGAFSSIDIGNGLSMITATADRAEAALASLAVFESRNGPGWRGGGPS